VLPEIVHPADPAVALNVMAPAPVPPLVFIVSAVPTNPLSEVILKAGCAVPTVVVAAAVVSTLVESVAVRTQTPVLLIESKLKVATPAMAAPVVVPPIVHGDAAVMVMTSFVPVPEVSTLPLVSSTDTLNVVNNVPAVATVVGGAVVKATLVAAPGSTVTRLLVAVASVRDASVAINVHEVPVLIATAENVATPPTAATVVVPSSVHVEDKTMESVAPVPEVIGMPLLSSTFTANAVITAPAITDVCGCVVKPNLLGVFVATATFAVVAVTAPLLVSVAMSWQLVPPEKVTPLKDATPELATTGVTALIVQPAAAVIPIVSDEFNTLPLVSSTETLNIGIAVPIVAVVDGVGDVKVRCGDVPAVTVTDAVALVMEVVLSWAVNVQGAPVDSNATSVNVAKPALAETVRVPARVHPDVSAIESVEPVPEVITALLESSTETANDAMFVPVAADEGGAVVNAT